MAIHDSGEMADFFSMFVHGFAETHLDALCHLPAAEPELTWNGKPLDGYHMPAEHTGTSTSGATASSRAACSTTSRGCAAPRASTAAQPVHGWELADAAAAQGVEPRAGDAVLIRSGFGPYFDAARRPAGLPLPRRRARLVYRVPRRHEASMLVWDMQDAPIADQGIPNPRGLAMPLHVHPILIPYMGMPILDNADFEALARRVRGRRPLGVPVRGRAARDPARHRLAGQPARDPLTSTVPA